MSEAAMDLMLAWADAEVRSVQADGDALCIHFAAVPAQPLSDGRALASEAGYARAVALVLARARWEGDLADCIGRLREGRLQIDGLWRSQLALPFDGTTAVRAELLFGNGTPLTVSAQALQCRWIAGPDFAESYAC
jgi:hypothetical protein